MAKKSRQFSTSDFTPEQVANNPALKKAYEEALAEEKRLADEKKTAASDKRKELKAQRAAEKQAAKEALDDAKESRKTSIKSTAASKDTQKKTAQRQKDSSRLDNVLQKLATGGVVGGAAKSIGSVVGGSIKQSTFGNMFNAKAVMGSMLGSLGVEQLAPVAIGGTVGRKSRRQSQVDAQDQKDNIKQLSIFHSMEQTLKSLLKVTIESNQYLSDLISAQTSDARQRIEASREANKSLDTGTLGAGASTGGEGGGLSGILGFLGGGLLKGVTKILGPLFAGMGVILEGLLSFSLTVAAPIALLVGIFASLKQQDWAKFFGSITDVFDDLAKGEWLKALEDGLKGIGNLLLTGLGRLTANILAFFGFGDLAKELDKWLDEHDIVQDVVDFVKNSWNYIVNAFNDTVDTVKSWIDSSFKLGDDIVIWFNNMWESTKQAFTDIKDFAIKKITQYIDIYASTFTEIFSSLAGSVTKIIDDITNGDILKAIIEFVTAIPNALIKGVGTLMSKILAFFGFEDASKTISDFVANFDLAKTVTDALDTIFKSISNVFTGMVDTMGNWLDSALSLLPAAIRPDNPFKKKETAKTSSQSTFSSMAAAGAPIPLSAETTVNEVPMDMGEGVVSSSYQASTSYKPLVNTKNISMAAQSGWNAMASAGAPQVVVMPSSAASDNGFREPPSNPRTSGAVSTAPAPSLLDRTLNNRAYFGLGYP